MSRRRLTDWTAGDLATNRKGHISPGQLRVLRRRALILLVTMVVFAAAAAAILPIYFWLGDGPSSALGITAESCIIVIGVLILVLVWRQVMSDLRTGAVIGVSGVVGLREVRYNNVTRHVTTIGGRDVRALYMGLWSLEGQFCMAYMLPRAQLVIAVEPVTVGSEAR